MLLQNFCSFINYKGVILRPRLVLILNTFFGDIVIWSVEDLEFLEILDNDEPHSTLLVHFNPKHIMFVSAGTHLAFYIPSVSPRVTIYIG